MTRAVDVASRELPPNTALGTRNLIINGDMRIAQRATSATASTGISYYTVDRFNFRDQNTGGYTIDQSTDAPTNFTHSTKITVTAADTSIASGERYWISTNLEGNTISHLNFGSSDAQTITLSFYVKSSLTGTFSGAFGNSAYDRSYAFEYTIASANTWERKTVTITGDTTGTWLTTNETGLRVFFDLGAATNRQITAGSWQAGSASAAIGASQVIANNGATFYITGVQLEVGEEATEFEHRPYDMELLRCQRYAYMIPNSDSTGVNDGAMVSTFGYMNTAGTFIGIYTMPVTMRNTPTISVTGTSNLEVAYADSTITTVNGTSVGVISHVSNRHQILYTVQGSAHASQPAFLRYATDTTVASFLIHAEL